MSAPYECWRIEDVPSDDVSLVEGYYDGRAGEPAPGANRPAAYHHGWWAGFSDRNPDRRPPWIPVLAAQIVAASRGRSH